MPYNIIEEVERLPFLGVNLLNYKTNWQPAVNSGSGCGETNFKLTLARWRGSGILVFKAWVIVVL